MRACTSAAVAGSTRAAHSRAQPPRQIWSLLASAAALLAPGGGCREALIFCSTAVCRKGALLQLQKLSTT
jgi:hypothetical protein